MALAVKSSLEWHEEWVGSRKSRGSSGCRLQGTALCRRYSTIGLAEFVEP